MAEPTNEMKVLLMSLGLFTVTWARSEAYLTCCVALAYYKLGGDAIEPEIPHALRRRIKFMRKCYNRLDVLTDLRTDGLSIMDSISDLAEDRHDLLHGVIDLDLSGVSTELARFKLTGGCFTVRPIEVGDILEIVDRALLLLKTIEDHSIQLRDHSLTFER